MIDLIDKLIKNAPDLGYDIKYIALSEELMKNLCAEIAAFTGTGVTWGSISKFKDIPIKQKDIAGFQVAYVTRTEDLPF